MTAASEQSGTFHFSPRSNRAHEIEWRDWGEAALEEAKALERPVLLSISAVWCHWCHVMDETTYSEPDIIAAINTEWLPIRVDNDVRPDVNARYNMGGWPTTAFLSPAGDILTGATYVPPDDMRNALRQVRAAYLTRRDEIARQAAEGRERARALRESAAGSLDAALVDQVLAAVVEAYDPVHGGFGPAPKFPQVDALLLLLEQASVRGDEALREKAVHTLEAMAGGGTYDHVEGGFFRYSTNADWSIPHFEKMLEDHGGLVEALGLAGLTPVLDLTTGYLDTVLLDSATHVYAGSQDADEEYYRRDQAGRRQLAPPYVDRRTYVAWNCMLAVGLMQAGLQLIKPDLVVSAGATLASLFARHRDSTGGLLHVIDGNSSTGGQLADQAWGLLAAVRAHSAGLGPEWLTTAIELAEHLEASYRVPGGGFRDHTGAESTGRLAEVLQPIAENSVAAMALVELDVLLGDPSAPHRPAAQRCLEAVAGLVPRYGIMAAGWARACDRFLSPPVKVTTADARLAALALTTNPYVVLEPAESGTANAGAIVCIGTTCLAPTTEASALVERVRHPKASAASGTTEPMA